jgi:hypothetical protein
MTMAYGSPGSEGSAWNARSCVHTRYASCSTAEGSYVLGSSAAGALWVVVVVLMARGLVEKEVRV